MFYHDREGSWGIEWMLVTGEEIFAQLLSLSRNKEIIYCTNGEEQKEDIVAIL
jgi:hypothetical protein